MRFLTKCTAAIGILGAAVSTTASAAGALPPVTLIPPAGNALYLVCDFTTGVIHYNCIPYYLSYVIQFIFGLTGAACILMIIIAGFQIAIAKAVGKDRNEGLTRLRVALIGFILCALSWFILDFIISSIAGL